MQQAAKRSPFTWEEDVPWILWNNSTSISMLPNPSPVETSKYQEDISSVIVERHLYEPIQPIIQRTRYNTILDRMNMAMKKTGNFTNCKQ